MYIKIKNSIFLINDIKIKPYNIINIMTLNQNLAEFRFNLDTLDMMVSMGRSMEQSCSTLSELGFNQQLVQFMQSNRGLLNMVLLRLQLYSEQNFTEQKVRSGLAVLNNPQVNVLLDHLYKPQSSVVSLSSAVPVSAPVKSKKSTPPSTPVISTPVPIEEECEADEEPDEECEAEENNFESFFTAHVTHTEDVSDSVKFKEMYAKFSEWWNNNNHEDEVPAKEELKEFLSSKLNQKIGTTVTHVRLD
jgi:hypothetical protein